MLHIIKLAVGVQDLDQLRAIQAERMRDSGVLRHRTRNSPRRRDAVLDGGSMYWVIAGSLLARQPIRDIIEDRWEDGSACAVLILDPRLVPLAGRPTRPFQGWRYLDPDDAPPDLAGIGAILGIDALPHGMRQELRALCLL